MEEQPPPGLEPEVIQQLEPKLSRRMLWWSLLIPGLRTTFAVLVILSTGTTGTDLELPFVTCVLIIGLVTTASWVAFALCISKRIVNPSLVLLILAYPIVQLLIVAALFFAGCLTLSMSKSL